MKLKNHWHKLRQLASELQIGEQKSGLECPFCEGGSTGEKTFSLTRETGAIRWFCHRDKCGMSGSSDDIKIEKSDLVHKHKMPEAPFPPHPTTVPLPDDIKEFLKAKYSLTETQILQGNFRWVEESKRVAMPLFGVYGQIGINYRSFTKGVKPKAYVRLDNLFTQKYCIYRYVQGGGRLLIVEDQLSALRASARMHTLALLGTHMSEELVTRIRHQGYQHIVLCLDGDAFAKALEIQKEFGPLFKTFPVRKLNKDIKNMNKEEVDKLLDDIIGATSSS